MKSETAAQVMSMSAPSKRPQTLKHQGMPSAAVPSIPFIMCSSDCVQKRMARVRNARQKRSTDRAATVNY